MEKFKIGDEVVVTEHNADIAEIGSSVLTVATSISVPVL